MVSWKIARRRGRALLLCCVALVAGAGRAQTPTSAPAPKATAARTFKNPIVRDAADPWIVCHGGYYYMTRTVGWGVAIRKSATLAGLGSAKDVAVWRGGGPGFEEFKHHVWAPELHRVRGKWYVYYTAAPGERGPEVDAGRRIFCLEGKTDDPLGAYTFKGKVAVPGDDFYAIDGTVFERPSDKNLFFLWSGREPTLGGAQSIYIAPMSDPWTISGPRVRLSSPQYDWERKGWHVNEGPEVLTRGTKTFVVYSGSGGTTPDYALGLLTNSDGNLLRAESWAKSEKPVFASYEWPQSSGGPVYTVGHNGFFKSPDGKEDWIIYHGKDNKDNTWGGRHARAQRFGWNPDGTPYFGVPYPPGLVLAAPSGEGRVATATRTSVPASRRPKAPRPKLP
jgi:GH43 family beta-xylosidase